MQQTDPDLALHPFSIAHFAHPKPEPETTGLWCSWLSIRKSAIPRGSYIDDGFTNPELIALLQHLANTNPVCGGKRMQLKLLLVRHAWAMRRPIDGSRIDNEHQRASCAVPNEANAFPNESIRTELS